MLGTTLTVALMFALPDSEPHSSKPSSSTSTSKTSTTASKKASSKTNHPPGWFAVDQDMDLDLDRSAEVRTLHHSKHDAVSAGSPLELSTQSNSSRKHLPGSPSDVSHLKIGQSVQAVLTAGSVGKGKKSAEPARETQLFGTLVHVDRVKGKITLRLQYLAPQGSIRKSRLSKQMVKELLDGLRVTQILVVSGEEAGK